MALRLSTGLKNAMLGETGFKGALANGVLRIYTGAQPASPDNAVAGTLLMEVTLNGGAFSHGSPTNGLNWDDPALGYIAKPAGDVWRGSGLAAGVAGWARFCANPADDGSSSDTLARLDMSVGVSTGDLRLSNVNIAVGAPSTVDAASLRLP